MVPSVVIDDEALNSTTRGASPEPGVAEKLATRPETALMMSNWSGTSPLTALK